MYSRFTLAGKYLSYYFSAMNGKGHGMHSPFVFEFITKVMNDKTHYEAYDKVEKIREQLKQDNSVLQVKDFGAGSAVSRSNQRTVSSIAKHTLKPPKYGKLLYRMVNYYKPSTIIELGTSLGITSSYLSLGNPFAKMITMEGASEVADAARNNFKELSIKNIELVEGNFDDTLNPVISGLSSIDFAFIDGNHRQEPTERYFQQLLAKTGNDSILVFDDIHWSTEMEAAWETIQKNPAVRCTLDLFFVGIVLFRQEFKEKQHFTIRF
ncbi:MAG: class I SAM-dependent methyltransferase [Bacteroidetes bacterium]|nr:class I SAM-dependent methyltransferase [Bacteroidota bacterium]